MTSTTDPADRRWLCSAIVAGFAATSLAGFALLLGYGLSSLLGAALPGSVGASFAALSSNVATAAVANALSAALLVHFTAGLAFAVAYTGLVAPRLSGPGWRRGILFALVPWALSLLAFLPAVGGGLLGLGLGAGALPILGSLAAHLVYGAALGWIYERDAAELLACDRESALANLGAEHGAAVGVLAGAVLGAAMGAALIQLGSDAASQALGAALLIDAAYGAAIGGVIGSYFGLTGTPG